MGDFNAKLEVTTPSITQTQSRNGKHMQKMIDETTTIPITPQAQTGKWTRCRKRKDTMERSIIDYVLMTKSIADLTKMVYVDEAGIHKLTEKEDTDHNTIVVEIELPTANKISKEKITNIKDDEGWHKFNQTIEERFRNKQPDNYDEYEQAIKVAMKKSFKWENISIKRQTKLRD